MAFSPTNTSPYGDDINSAADAAEAFGSLGSKRREVASVGDGEDLGKNPGAARYDILFRGARPDLATVPGFDGVLI
jgi:hypothetical protein